MRILVATKEGQGQRRNDFCHAREGEIVVFGSECDGETVDGSCGCRRAMVGSLSLKSTTTMKVVDMPHAEFRIRTAIRRRMERGGWDKLMTPEEIAEEVEADARELLRLAAAFPVGMIVERRGNQFQERRVMALAA